MRGVTGVSFLLLIVLSGSLGEKERERGLKREEENGRRIGIETGRESSKLSGSKTGAREIRNLSGRKDKTIEKGGKGDESESRNLLGSLLLKQPSSYRRQPLRLPGVGTPRGFIHSKLKCWW